MQIKTNVHPKNLFKSVSNISNNISSRFKKGGGVLIDKQPREIGVFNYGLYNHNANTENEVNELNNKYINNHMRLYPSTQNI